MGWSLFGDIPKDPCEPFGKPEKWDIYAKNQYCPKIQITNWWYHREGYPKDYDDVTNAAYKRWGTYKEDENFWKTETMAAMEEGRGDAALNEFKNNVDSIKFLNFLSYPATMKTRKDLLPDEIRKILPSLSKDDLTLRYTTTNQAHYKRIHIKPKRPPKPTPPTSNFIYP